jgi:phosphatidylserine/phosphatidylglycerophosphate/cardiolipin synthase-like enzyme
VRAHHRRRLARIGHERVFDASALSWAETATFPARAGNSVELLVDGAAALPRIAADVEAARSHVHLAGWYFTPGLRLGDGGPTLAGLLGETAERIPLRVIAWAGAPLPLFHPDRGEVRAMRDRLVHGTRIEVALDSKERPMHCHHEKLVLVDDRVAYVGGSISRPSPATGSMGGVTTPAAGLGGTTRASGWRGRSSPTSPSTSACAGTR